MQLFICTVVQHNGCYVATYFKEKIPQKHEIFKKNFPPRAGGAGGSDLKAGGLNLKVQPPRTPRKTIIVFFPQGFARGVEP